MGELMDVLDPALPSASRPKTHYRGQPLTPAKTTEARTENRSPTAERSIVPAESAGVRDPALGAGADGAGDVPGLESASISGTGVAGRVSVGLPREATDFRGQ